MIFHWPSAIFATFFYFGLILTDKYALGDLWYVSGAIGVFVLASLVVGRYIARHVFFAIVPVIFSVATLMLLFFIDIQYQKNIFIGVSAILIYFTVLGAYRLSHNLRDAIARGLLTTGATSAIFFFYAATFGVYLNFVMPQWLLAMIICLVTTIIAWQYFVTISQGFIGQVTIYSIIIGVIMAEVTIIASWWPFGYLTISVVLLMVYYILWDIAQSFFLDRLSKTRISVNIIFLFILAVLVLGTSRWLPG